MRLVVLALCSLALCSLALCASASAQAPDPCTRGWASLLAGDLDVAEVLLDQGIAALGEPTTPVLRRRLAACLYSRGRAYEVREWAPQRAIELYTRSLALRPNALVTARLAALTACRAADWSERADEDDDERQAELTHALQAATPHTRDHVDVLGWRIDAASGREVALVGTWVEDGGFADHQLVIASRDRAGPWSVATLAEVPNPNGSVEYELHVAPGPDGSSTFVVLQEWDDRACCDDEDMPDWTSGTNAWLAWRDASGAWRSGVLDDDSLGDAPTLTFTPEGSVMVDRPRHGPGSRRVRSLVGTHPRDAWIAP